MLVWESESDSPAGKVTVKVSFQGGNEGTRVKEDVPTTGGGGGRESTGEPLAAPANRWQATTDRRWRRQSRAMAWRRCGPIEHPQTCGQSGGHLMATCIPGRAKTRMRRQRIARCVRVRAVVAESWWGIAGATRSMSWQRLRGEIYLFIALTR